MCHPAQTIISAPVQTAVWYPRASGALAVRVEIQESVSGLYLPRYLSITVHPVRPDNHLGSGPDHSMIPPGLRALVIEITPRIGSRIVSAAGIQVATAISSQTIISVPVQTAVWEPLAAGALVSEVATQESVVGSYLPQC